MRLEGKGAVVTGGGRGLGREVVLLMAGEGAGVVVFDVNADGAEAVAAEAREAGGRAVAFGATSPTRTTWRPRSPAAATSSRAST